MKKCPWWRRRIRCRRGTHDNNKHQHGAAALGSCGRAPYHIAVRSSPVRANGGTVAPSTRRTTALARFEIGGDWASVGLVGRLAWWFLRPSATRRVFFLFQPTQRKRQTPSTQHRAAGAVGHPAPASLSPVHPPAQALGGRPPADPARRGDLQGCSPPPASTDHCLGPRHPPAVPTAGGRRGHLQASSHPTPVLRPRSFHELASPLVTARSTRQHYSRLNLYSRVTGR